MSLEDSISKLADAIERLADATVAQYVRPPMLGTPPPVVVVAADRPNATPAGVLAPAEATARAKAEKAAKVAEKATEKAATAAVEAHNEAKKAAAPAEVTREQVATQLIAVVKAKGRQTAVDILATFGAKTVGEVAAEKLAELHAALVGAA